MENFINNAPFIVVLICLIVGFVFLVKGADMFVEGSSSVAKRFKVPSLIIGLTIVAMGTSLPETAVSVAASQMGGTAVRQLIQRLRGENYEKKTMLDYDILFRKSTN